MFREGADNVAIVTYNLKADLVLSFNDSLGFSKAEVFDRIDGIEAGGYTNASDGISVAHDEFKRIIRQKGPDSFARYAMVVFSDGAQTAQPA